MGLSAQQTPAQNVHKPHTPHTPHTPHKIIRALRHILYGFVAIFLIAIALLWWWAGTDDSLAQAVQLGQTCCGKPLQVLTVEHARGSLRSGGSIGRLVWQQGGLTVTAHGVRLAWQPLALLNRTLELHHLSLDSLEIKDQRPPAFAPAPAPPQSLNLPLRVTLKAFSIASLHWWATPSLGAAFSALDVAGRYGFDGVQHALTLTHTQIASGHYSGNAALTAKHPLRLSAHLKGALSVKAPGATARTPLSLVFEATAAGPLTTLDIAATVQLATQTVAQEATKTDANKPPHAKLNATLTPWAAQLLARLEADVHDLDIAALWVNAPHTLLTGQAKVWPLDNTPPAQTPSLQVQLHLTNRLVGPVNQQRLPLDKLDVTGQWRQGVMMVRALKALGAGGELVAHGQWTDSTAAATATSKPTAPQWKLQTTLKNIHPAKLHSQLSAPPFHGQAALQSQGTAIAFDAKFDTKVDTKFNAKPDANVSPSLQSAHAAGRWQRTQTGTTLVLSALKVQSADTQISGQIQAELDPHHTAHSGQGQLRLTAPGLEAKLEGTLGQASGAGNISIDSKDAAKALHWLQQLPSQLGLPGLANPIQNATATGSARLTARWQGGWQDPMVQTQLELPSLDWRTNADSHTPVMKFRAVQASVSGRMSQADISAQGSVESGEQRYRLQLTAQAGRTPTTAQITAQATPQSTSSWQGVLKQLTLSATHPALGNSAWQLITRSTVAFKWMATTPFTPFDGDMFETSAGQAVLSTTTPTQPSALTALLAWQPVRWRPGAFSSSGKLTGLPMAWLTALAGPQTASMGLSGNLVFDADWDARLTDTLRLKASLARSSGDITLQAEAAQVGAARIAAGVKQAHLGLQTTGDDVTLSLLWNSERAGNIEGQLQTRLKPATATSQAALGNTGDIALGNWRWPLNAPLAGQLRAQLPRIGVWSALAPPGWRIRGSLGANMTVQGTREAPQLTGDLEANDLALRSVVDGIAFGNGRLRAQLDGTRMTIQEFTLQGAGAKDTGGTLTAQGEALWHNGQPRVALSAQLKRLRASIRTDRHITLSGDLQAKLEGKLTQFSGQLKIDQARIVLPEESTPTLGDDVMLRSAPGSLDQATLNPTTRAVQATPAVKLNIALDMGQDFRVQGKGMDTLVRGALTLSGESLTEPRLVGTVNTFAGQYRAYGQRLDIAQGLLRFTGTLDNPSLDILAIRPNPTQAGPRVGVQILGTALLPRVRLYAEPELPDAEKLSWLVLGRSSSTGGGEAALLQQAALTLFGNKAGGVSGGLAASLGLDELSFRGSSNNADGTTSQSAVTLGKRFSRNFYASYERTISGALGTLYVFYDLSQRFTVRAQAGQQSAIDLIFTVPYD